MPPVPIELAQLPAKGATHVLLVRARKTDPLHATASGRCSVRVGTQDKRVLGGELLRLAETKSKVSFEEQRLDAGLEVIETAALDEYYQARRAVTTYDPRLDAAQLLQ